MYKLLLCWRYLWTRYLALACIVSVMLGVATLIVVNSVMGGFSTKLKDRLHGLLSDVLIESMAHDGFADPHEKIQRILRSSVGPKIEALTPTIECLGLIQIRYRGENMQPRAVRLIGVDAQSRARVGGFAEYLVDPRNKEQPSFELRPEARRYHEEHYQPLPPPPVSLPGKAGEIPPPKQPPMEAKPPAGVFVGYSIAHYRVRKATADDPNKDVPIVQPGDEVILTTVSGQRLAPVYDSVVVADFFKSEMSEYDGNYIFVPLTWMQQLRTMENRANSIQIKLKDYRDAREVVNVLQSLFPVEAGYQVETWEDKQGPLLAAISIEKGILNVLLFLIICVAGFGILAIFAMIVVEKTRDIGILKALGASNGGVMKIFLGYGLLLGVIGAGLGTALGLTLTAYINDIERFLGHLTGQEIFPRDVYYFDRIPTDVQMASVALVNAGAVAIAVFFSVLPALRAALLHPVRALRYE
jgi:lipoprotein-releasing system permease protein